MIEKAEQGIYPSFAPRGYINVECNGKRFIQPNPVVGSQTCQLFEWYATGNYSLLELSRKAHDEGINLLELALHAVTMYKKQTEREKRRIINFVCSNSIWKDGRLIPNYRQPFNIMAEKNLIYRQKKDVSPEKNALRPFWLPGTDSNRRQGG